METLLSSFGFKKKMPPPSTILITVDKSHLITIGEQLYTESIELIRELVNNAYDADARVAEVFISENTIRVQDDGNGMDLKGTVIFINRDHSLYQRATKKASTYTLHIARLLTQEIALMKDPRSPRQAFARQSKLLKDAFSEG